MVEETASAMDAGWVVALVAVLGEGWAARSVLGLAEMSASGSAPPWGLSSEAQMAPLVAASLGAAMAAAMVQGSAQARAFGRAPGLE